MTSDSITAEYTTTTTAPIPPTIIIPRAPTVALRTRVRPILAGTLFGLSFVLAIVLIWLGMIVSVRYGDGAAVLAALGCGAALYVLFGRK